MYCFIQADKRYLIRRCLFAQPAINVGVGLILLVVVLTFWSCFRHGFYLLLLVQRLEFSSRLK